MTAIILLSGGLDSTVVLAHALAQDKRCTTLAFDYGQRCRFELEAAYNIAHHYQVPIKTIAIDSSAFSQTALLPHSCAVPKDRSEQDLLSTTPPPTYVPARNTIFLSYAMGEAETSHAAEIHIGAMAGDYAYPDCQKAYFAVWQQLLNVAVPNYPIALHTPLIDLTKEEILRLGERYDVPWHLTMSCYDPIDKTLHCGHCDSCIYRRKGFQQAQIEDTAPYTELVLS